MTALASRPPDVPVAEGILLRDCLLWKSARTAWHRLLIAGMLMDYDTKKSLATVFTKNYGMHFTYLYLELYFIENLTYYFIIS